MLWEKIISQLKHFHYPFQFYCTYERSLITDTRRLAQESCEEVDHRAFEAEGILTILMITYEIKLLNVTKLVLRIHKEIDMKNRIRASC